MNGGALVDKQPVVVGGSVLQSVVWYIAHTHTIDRHSLVPVCTHPVSEAGECETLARPDIVSRSDDSTSLSHQ